MSHTMSRGFADELEPDLEVPENPLAAAYQTLGNLLTTPKAKERENRRRNIHSQQVLGNSPLSSLGMTDDIPYPWFSLTVHAPEDTCYTTVNIQPLHTNSLRPEGNEPVFVRIFNIRSGTTEGIQALFNVDDRYLQLVEFDLPDDPITAIEQLKTLQDPFRQHPHKDSLKTLDQHRSQAPFDLRAILLVEGEFSD